jgi:4-amino-4-deoxychorismate lyase
LYLETIKCIGANPKHLDYHQKRIANTISLDIDLSKYIKPPINKLLKCRVIYNTQGIIDITYTPYIQKQIRSFKIVYNNNINYSTKKVNRGY